MNALDKITDLVKAIEAGNYNAAPSTLVQGSATQIEDLSNLMNNVTFQNEHIKLQKMLKVTSCKSMLAQFVRQLSYGQGFGGMAQLEGNVGKEQTSDMVRVVVPMCFYSHTRRVTLQSNLVETFDGVKAEDRASADAAMLIAGAIEIDCFRGKDDFSNAGVFDGNPLVVPTLPNMNGLGLQIRQSDAQKNAQDLMFSEYGSDDTVVISGGSALTQDNIEDASTRSALNFGSADKLVVDPKVLSNYNKIAFGKERIILAGSPQDATGADLRKQWVSGGTVTVESSQFLRGKAKPERASEFSPLAPTATTAASAAGSSVTAFIAGQVYQYYATSANEVGESVPGPTASVTVATTGDALTVTITHPGSGTVRYFNVYRTVAGATVGTAKFVGRVILTAGSGTTAFTDLSNKLPGFVTGYLIQGDTMELKELAPYSRIKLAMNDLSFPEAHYRFTSLAVTQPRKNVILDNLK